jgi:hypothetical protein
MWQKKNVAQVIILDHKTPIFFIVLSTKPPTYHLPTYLFIYLPTYLFTYLPTYLFSYLYIYLPTYQPTYLPQARCIHLDIAWGGPTYLHA